MVFGMIYRCHKLAEFEPERRFDGPVIQHHMPDEALAAWDDAGIVLLRNGMTDADV
jgi:hypothetical protein